MASECDVRHAREVGVLSKTRLSRVSLAGFIFHRHRHRARNGRSNWTAKGGATRGGWRHLRVRICIWVARCGNIAANQGTIPEYACKNKASRGEGVLDAPFKLVGQVASSSRGVKTADEEDSGHLDAGGRLAVEVVGVEVVVVESKTLDVLVFRARIEFEQR